MYSHINNFLSLAASLRERSHETVMFSIASNSAHILERGCEFRLLEPDTVPSGTLDTMLRQVSNLSPRAIMQWFGTIESLRYEGILKNGLSMIEKERLELLVVDQAEACTGSLAEAAGLPWATVCNSLPLNSEPGVPPFFSTRIFSEKWPSIVRNRLANAGLELTTRKTRTMINAYRKRWQLKPLEDLDQTFSPYLQISQLAPEFDFPRCRLPLHFHYSGYTAPFGAGSASSVDFPWDRLDGRPLIFASLGTVSNQRDHAYRCILEACSGVEGQLVLSLGGAGHSEDYRAIARDAIVVNFAPQVQLLQRAALMITHAGLNSTLESLSNGVPMVAIPFVFDQPGVAARISWSGAGEFIPSSQLKANRLQAAILQVLQKSSYREAAVKIGSAVTSRGGLREAFRLVETLIRTGKPVLSQLPSVPVSS